MADEEEVRTEPSPNAAGVSVAVAGRMGPEPKWLGERLARAATKAKADLLGELGVADEADLEAARLAIAENRARRKSPEELHAIAQEQEQEINRLMEANRRNTLAAGLYDAMHAHEDRFIDPQGAALEFTDPRRPDRIGLDEKGQVIVYRQGKPTQESPAKFVEKWTESQRNWHQLRPLCAGGGAGSRTAISGPEREGAPRGGVHDPYMTKRSEAARKAFVEAMRGGRR
jgi:hypothetical protein